MEAATIDNLINESQSTDQPAEETATLYPFDAEFIVVSFNARPNADTPKFVYHKLRKPTLHELKDRESQVRSELVSVNSYEDEENMDDAQANANLWDKLIIAVKGYKEAKDDWRALSAEEKAQMKRGHKSQAIRCLYAGSCAIEANEDDDISIGAETWIVRQEIGRGRTPDFVVRHSLREPNEREWERFKCTARRVSYVRGKKTRTKINTSLQAYCDLYDAILLSVDGGTVNNKTLSADNRKIFLAAVDPIWKRQIIETFMDALEGQSLD